MRLYEDMKRYKAAVMGLTMLLIVAGHVYYYQSGLHDYTTLGPVSWYAVGAVDIYMFLSGFGVAHSLRKDGDALRFMGRRLKRLLPSYLPIIFVYCVFGFAIGYLSKAQVIGNLSSFSWWTQQGKHFNWYVPVLLVFYLLSPMMYELIHRHGRKSLWLFALFLLMDGACIGTSVFMGVSRFPIYFLGLYIGHLYTEGWRPSRSFLLLTAAAALLGIASIPLLVRFAPGTMSRLGTWWHPYFFVAPGIVFGCSSLFGRAAQHRATAWIERFMAFLGKNSFEIYLMHLLVFFMAYQLHIWSLWFWWLMALVGFVLGCIYGAAVRAVTAAVKQKRNS